MFCKVSKFIPGHEKVSSPALNHMANIEHSRNWNFSVSQDF